MPAPVSPDAERLMELHDAVVAALRATYKAKGDEAWLAACEDLGRAKAAFRAALFAAFQPDAGAMVEAREIVREWYHGPIKDAVGKLESRLVAAIATALTRREAAGFARGVEAVCKIADSMSLQWSRAGAQETARRLASAGRALLGEGKE
jgi:hypothetical protein